MGEDSIEILKGTLDMLVLRTLHDGGAMHGWAITRRLDELSGSAFQIDEGSMYPALYRMQKRGWVRSEWRQTENNRRARFYEITPAGCRHLEREASNWARYTRAVARVMEPSPDPAP